MEIAGTVGLISDEQDFRAMQQYSTFTFTDFAVYLTALEALLRNREAEGIQMQVALFDPQEFADFCASAGRNPDSPDSRARYTAHLATTGPALPHTGQALADLIPPLIEGALRQATWEYASAVLARLGACTVCGKDIGQAAYARASALLARILDTARQGLSHLVVCSVAAGPETVTAVLRADTDPEGAIRLHEAAALEFTAVLALGLATGSAGGLVMRTTSRSAPDQVYGWRMRMGDLEALTASEVFDAYCTDAESGSLISPEPDVDYCPPPDLGLDTTSPGDGH
ncbi:hypothetical protein [Streptomyces sp. NPDC047065]|uniref:hypothetical protein n=1 Tax=Streptomyces sp. NPDC047065 TaxID=3154606 RepID=UPI0033C2707F